jgi:hypothetical protein
MGKSIRIKAAKVTVTAELNDTKTAQAIWNALPIKSRGERWGDEIYFAIPVSLEAENAHELVTMGDLGYWPPGSAFCIFFGPTPMSRGKEIRPASPVNVFGRIIGNAEALKTVKSGSEIIVERAKD